jgi:hypothetical protein
LQRERWLSPRLRGQRLEEALPSKNKLIDNLIVNTPDWRGTTVTKLRKLIHDADPEIVEECKWMRPSNPLGVAVFEHNGIVCFVGVLKERVRITFWAGSILPDPQKLFNSMLNGKSRGIDFSEGEKIDDAALKAIIKAAVQINLDKAKPAKARKGK